MINRILKALNTEDSMISTLKNEIAETVKSINNLIKAIGQGIITKATNQRLDEPEQQKRNLLIAINKEELTNPKLTKGLTRFW